MSQVKPAAEAAATKPKYLHKIWFQFGGQELSSIIKHRDNVMSKLRETCSRVTNGMDETLKEANKRVKDAVKKAKANYKSHIANKATEKLLNFDPKNAWVAIKEITDGLGGHHVKPKRMAMKMANGEKSSNNKEHMSVFQPHFSKLYNNHRSPYANAADFIKQREKFAALDFDVSWDEFISAVNDLKNDKAPGLNGVPPNAFKAMDDQNLKKVYDLTRWCQGARCSQWSNFLIVVNP